MRPPDLIIGTRAEPQTLRWHLFKWRGIQVALHCWLRSDNDRALHDHSADNISLLLWGSYREHFAHAWEDPEDEDHQRWAVEIDGRPSLWPRLRLPFIPYFRKAETPHRVELHRGGPVWTLWIRFKPRREWGFWCPRGWRHWKDYTSSRDYSAPGSESSVGKGCD